MMMSQQEYNVHFQRTRTLHVRIELLNQFDNVIDRIEGLSTDGSVNLSGNSTYRRTGNLSMVVKNKTILPSPSSLIWFNRKIKVYVGLSGYDEIIYWFNQGIYLIRNVEISRASNENRMSLELLDLMSTLDGTFSGTVNYETKLLAEGITISDAIRTTLSSLGKVSVDNLQVNGSDALLPYDLEKDATATVYDVTSELLNLYMGWEFFVNPDGWFVVQKIKDTKSDPVAWDFTQNKMDLVVNSTSKINFDNVRNSVIIWGKKMDDGSQAHWIYRNKYARDTNLEMLAITDAEVGDICFIYNEQKSYYWNGTNWSILTFNVVPEYRIEEIGVRNHVYTSETIFNNDQAMLRAEYELEQKSNFAETVSLSCLPIFGLECSEKIKLYDEKSGIDGEYKINDISLPMDISSPMTINATKLYY